jgi:hypothetical protein
MQTHTRTMRVKLGARRNRPGCRELHARELRTHDGRITAVLASNPSSPVSSLKAGSTLQPALLAAGFALFASLSVQRCPS